MFYFNGWIFQNLKDPFFRHHSQSIFQVLLAIRPLSIAHQQFCRIQIQGKLKMVKLLQKFRHRKKQLAIQWKLKELLALKFKILRLNVAKITSKIPILTRDHKILLAIFSRCKLDSDYFTLRSFNCPLHCTNKIAVQIPNILTVDSIYFIVYDCMSYFILYATS